MMEIGFFAELTIHHLTKLYTPPITFCERQVHPRLSQMMFQLWRLGIPVHRVWLQAAAFPITSQVMTMV